jgi:hypothetical protein
MANVKETKRERDRRLIAESESALIVKYGDKIVEGSVRRATRGKHVGKLTVEIRTVDENGERDGKTLRVATSDVHQVNHQPDVNRKLYIARKNERARQRRAEARAKKAVSV